MDKLKEMQLEENRTRIDGVIELASVEALHFNPVQTNVSVDWTSDEFIGDQVLPFWEVSGEDQKIAIWDRDDQFRQPDDVASSRSTVKVEDIGLSSFTPRPKLYATSDVVTPQDLRQAANIGLAYYMNKITEFKTEQILRSFEKRVADLIFGSANYLVAQRLQLAGPTLWSDKANSDPVGDMFTAIDTVFKHPTHLIFGRAYWRQFRQHPKILDAIKGMTGVAPRGGAVTSQQVAEFFEVPNVMIGRARYNTTAKGQTATYADIWGNGCAILYIDPNPGPRTMTFGATFTDLKRWVGTYFDNTIGLEGGTIVKVGMKTHEYVVSNALGYLIYQ